MNHDMALMAAYRSSLKPYLCSSFPFLSRVSTRILDSVAVEVTVKK